VTSKAGFAAFKGESKGKGKGKEREKETKGKGLAFIMLIYPAVRQIGW
jgi:hypothetical protein